MVCDSVKQIITKGKKICARHWMLIEEIMKMLNVPFFDGIDHLDPTNLHISAVEVQREQTVSTIQNLSQVDVSSFRLFTTAPAQL